MSRLKRILAAIEGVADEFAVAPKAARPARRQAQPALPSQNPLAVQLQRAAQPKVKALPPPPQRPALPPPDPSKQLPDFAVKPRGGQWMSRGKGSTYDFGDFSPDKVASDTIPSGLLFSSDPNDHALRDWYKRALTKYVMNDMGTPDDPIRSLAERGLAHKADLTPEQWSDLAAQTIVGDELVGSYLLPDNMSGGMPGAGSELRADALRLMPWLAKVPTTDPLYRVNSGGFGALEFGHVADELRQAMKPDIYGIPQDLAVRPESLARMSFPQAVERVGRINQFRVKQMEEAAQQRLNSPAIQTYKEYAENNPMGLRWVELRPPQYQLPEGYTISRDVLPTEGGSVDWYQVLDATGKPVGGGGDESEALKQAFSFTDHDPRKALEDELRYEGDTMGHCVGGYCDEVLSGRSRIFSLRDAKGQPHVTIETGRALPTRNFDGLRHDVPDDADIDLYDTAMRALLERGDDALFDAEGNFTSFGSAEFNREQDLAAYNWLSANGPEDIVQIKGKQNRAPKDDYLPFVQDFVRSGTWGNIGDLGNTGLVKLPDGRYISKQHWQEGLRSAMPQLNPDWSPEAIDMAVSTASPTGQAGADWDVLAPYFEGYAIGGRVERNRCFSRSPLSVR